MSRWVRLPLRHDSAPRLAGVYWQLSRHRLASRGSWATCSRKSRSKMGMGHKALGGLSTVDEAQDLLLPNLHTTVD